jgi:hypothetical protein
VTKPCFVCGAAMPDGGHAARLIVPGPGLVTACGPVCAGDRRFLMDPPPDDLAYTGRVHQGYGAGLLGEAFPADMPIGSAWAFGFRHGAVDRRNTLALAERKWQAAEADAINPKLPG